jgi:hypothetical protein
MVETSPKARPRCSPGKLPVTMAGEFEASIAPPTACSARKAISIVADHAMPHSAELATKIPNPHT